MAQPTNAAIVDLNGRKWQPFESAGTGHVTYTEDAGEIHIPYGTDPISLTIQAHELAHVRYSSKVWPNIHMALPELKRKAGTNSAIVGYAEDMRTAALAGRLNVKTLPSFEDKLDAEVIKDWIDGFVSQGIPVNRVQKAARFILTEHTSVLKRIGLDINSLQHPAHAERYVVYCAQYIHKLLSKGEAGDDKSDSSGERDKSPDAKGKPEADGKGKPKGSEKSEPAEPTEAGEGDEAAGDDASDGDSDEGDDEGEGSADGPAAGEATSAKSSPGEPKGDAKGEIPISTMNLPDIRQAMVSKVPPPVDTAKLIQDFQHTLNTADWIPVTQFERMPLVRRAAQARRKGRKLSEAGVVLGSVYDAVSPNERRPFVAKRKGGVGGLTVVIDCSSSMAISEAEIEAMLAAHPQSVVVTYSSEPHRGIAHVRIIASHGRLAAMENFRKSGAPGNGCDGPVLEWLAKQPGERVWVCDGAITGKRDQLVTHVSFDAADPGAAWLKAKRVTRFHSLGDYLESLAKR